MQENKLFETLLDVVPFAAYAIDINTYEMVYANKMMHDKMYAPRESFCWKKLFGQEEACSWCTIPTLKQRDKVYKNDKLVSVFFDETTDRWMQTYDELVKWPDGRTVKYSIAVDITELKEVQASMIKTHTKLAIQTKSLREANEKLESLATKDFLTGINNRGNFFKLAGDIWDGEYEIYVAMLDIDKFKLLNDIHGHKTGDTALQLFAKTVQNRLDNSYIFARLGGEEFGIISVGKTQEELLVLLESIRQDIQTADIDAQTQKVKMTVSMGLARKESGETIDMTLDKADQMLYKAKDGGRNRIMFRSEG